MDGKTTIKYLQHYIKQKDYNPELLKDYFLKLSEEVWDVIYYAIAIANIYNIDLEQVIKTKSEMNQSRYPSSVMFEENR